MPFLERLARGSRLLGVVASPDRPAGRGYVLTPPPVKRAAQALGVPVHQPEQLKDFSLKGVFGRAPDLGIVVAYGHVIPPSVFEEPAQGLVNVHFSLVPKYRGAGPIQWALINGERETGVSLFRIEKGLDTGPVYLQAPVPIAPEDNASTLREKLVARGLGLQDEFLLRLERGPWAPTPQAGSPIPAPLLKKEDGVIRWSRQSAPEVVNLIRGTWEWPGAWARFKGQRVRIRAAEVVGTDVPLKTNVPSGANVPPGTNVPSGTNVPPGTVAGLEKGRGFLVQCSTGMVRIFRVQPEGKKEMDATDFWNGARLAVGDCFTEE